MRKNYVNQKKNSVLIHLNKRKETAFKQSLMYKLDNFSGPL